MLVEKSRLKRHKPCAGILPSVCIDILGDLGLKIPTQLMSSPPTLGLFLVPPSGRSASGCLENYRFLNVNRDGLDEWLLRRAENAGTEILNEAEFVRLKEHNGMEALIKARDRTIKLSTQYIIGADGALSTMRRQLYSDKVSNLQILQEYWLADGNFNDCFYAFFSDNITPAYSYVVPKDEYLIVGTGVPQRHHTSALDCLIKFKQWLSSEFEFCPIRLVKREAAAIPYHHPLCGKENIILVGDAAGFCNPFSGEGVRLGIESAIAAAEALLQAENDHTTLSSAYMQQVKSLTQFIHETLEFAINITDDGREEFIKSRLTHSTLNPLQR